MFASKLLKGVLIVKQDYRNISNYVKAGDSVYLDPCYDPIKRTSFAHYTPKRFSVEDREELFKFVIKLTKIGAKVILSNNNINKVKKLYEDAKFKINYVEASRCVNSDPDGRGKITELLITNYGWIRVWFNFEERSKSIYL